MELAANSLPVWKAILWCFYPIGALVMIELFLRGPDDDDDGDGGVRTPVYSYNPI